ncbi:hypothetical protein [Nitrosomonas supralitoralis]|uniref:Uncharacterized protein n=1 Tax=Nitrosomonas supralitoralis TaxID=2116706 RepID=A0A2P7NVY5_9PROT|nr:hypothetical protein [Nitrosomonas supralitoralis]PSJ17632.1 hypothetical protein C7H79_06930 [Nitrosomonas supralitoralis]
MTPLLSALKAWHGIIFSGLGLYTAKNSTVFAILFIRKVSASSAVILVEELSRPIEGLMQIFIDLLYNEVNQINQ